MVYEVKDDEEVDVILGCVRNYMHQDHIARAIQLSAATLNISCFVLQPKNLERCCGVVLICGVVEVDSRCVKTKRKFLCPKN